MRRPDGHKQFLVLVTIWVTENNRMTGDKCKTWNKQKNGYLCLNICF